MWKIDSGFALKSTPRWVKIDLGRVIDVVSKGLGGAEHNHVRLLVRPEVLGHLNRRELNRCELKRCEFSRV